MPLEGAVMGFAALNPTCWGVENAILTLAPNHHHITPMQPTTAQWS
jgi:hypothetical protein